MHATARDPVEEARVLLDGEWLTRASDLNVGLRHKTVDAGDRRPPQTKLTKGFWYFFQKTAASLLPTNPAANSPGSNALKSPACSPTPTA